MNFRRTIHSIVALTLFVTSGLAHGQAVDGHFVNGDAGEFIHRVAELNRNSPLPKMLAETRAEDMRAIRAGRKALGAVKWGGSQLAHSAQTLTLLWTLAAVEGVMQEHHLAPLHDKSTAWTEVVTRAGDGLINHTALYASMLGGAATGTAAAYPLAHLTRAVHEAVPHAFSAKLLAGTAGSFVTFVGWEAGSRLWDEAIFNLSINDTGVDRTPAEQARLEADLKIAQGLRIFDLARGVGSADEKRVFALVMNNVLELLTLTHPERTANWIANTLRLNVLNGEFITIVTTMTVAGTVAGSLVASPWLGAVVGFGGGLAGGFAAHFVPEKNKQRITDTFRNVSRQAADLRLQNNAHRLAQARASLNFRGDDPRPYSIRELDEALLQRVRERQKLGTTLFTQIYDAATKFQDAELHLNMAEQMLAKNNPETKAKLEDLKKEFGQATVKARGRTEKFLGRLLSFYEAESAYVSTLFGPTDTKNFEVRTLVEGHLRDLEATTTMLRYLYAGLLPDAAARLGLDDVTADNAAGIAAAANVYINQFNLRGFEESLLNGSARGSTK